MSLIGYDVATNYKYIGENLVEQYISIYDSMDYRQLDSCFHPNAKITFIEEEMVGFNAMLNTAYYNHGIVKFDHQINSIDTQPLGDTTVMIMITGLIAVNSNFVDVRHFSEVILVNRQSSGAYVIINSILRLIA